MCALEIENHISGLLHQLIYEIYMRLMPKYKFFLFFFFNYTAKT